MPDWRKCAFCGADFVATHSQKEQRYCTQKCAGFSHWRPKRGSPTWQVLAKQLATGLLEIAGQAMPDTYFQTDSRCKLAREVLGGSTE